MAVQAGSSWDSLPPETREVFEWAAACQTRSEVVGTGTILIGLLRAGNGASPADTLLRHFDVRPDVLYRVLEESDPAIDPYIAKRKKLTDWPMMTPRAESCLVRAGELREDVTALDLNVKCLFGAVLASEGTARSRLADVLGLAGVSMGEVAEHYLAWLTSGTVSYAEALEILPAAAPTDLVSSSEGRAHLVTLLQRQAQTGSRDQVAALSLVIANDLLLTTAESARASHALLEGDSHELDWRTIGETLAVARLVTQDQQFHSRPLIRELGPGQTLRCYAVSDRGATVRELAIEPTPDGMPVGDLRFLQLATEPPAGYIVTGSPILDDEDGVVGMIERGSGRNLVMIGASTIRDFIAKLKVPADADPAAAIVIGNASGAGNDQVAKTDQLGFQVYVKAFADLIRAEHTEPPLTIGIFGSWGMGKSFLLEHITQDIDRQQQADSSGPRIRTVRFNAWEYLASDAIWPALVRKIVTELDRLSSWPWHKRVLTRLWWNARRESRSLRTRLVTAVLVLALTVALAVGKNGLALGLGGLTALLGLGSLIKAANEPVGKWVTGLFESSDYGGQIDVMAEIKHDLEELERRLHVDGRTDRVLVVIDDLDRCEPAKAVEVLQAVNQLLSFPSFIVCLGIDARIITAAVEKHYEGLLGVAGASGYEYLDKIVQIPFRIPEPGTTEVTEFIRTQLGVPIDLVQPAAPTATVAETGSSDFEPQAASSSVEPIPSDGSVEQAEPRPVSGAGESAYQPLARSEVLFTADELQAFRQFVPYLRPNPRHLKRLINVYRLVRSLGLAEGERLVLDRPAAVLRWLIMWAQWPLTSSMLLRRLDSAAADQLSEPDPMLSLLSQVEQSIDRKARADRDDDPAKLRGLFQVPGCVLSIEEIKRIRRYTVNFNPAIEEQLRGSDNDPPEVPAPA